MCLSPETERILCVSYLRHYVLTCPLKKKIKNIATNIINTIVTGIVQLLKKHNLRIVFSNLAVTSEVYQI